MSDECEELLLEVVCQACMLPDRTLDSMALRSYADAIRYLEKKGKVKILKDAGRRVIAVEVMRDEGITREDKR